MVEYICKILNEKGEVAAMFVSSKPIKYTMTYETK